MTEALVIIDMLNDFVRSGAPLEVPRARKILKPLEKRLKKARKKGMPVVFVSDAHAPDDPEFSKMGWPVHAVRGTEGAQVVDELAPETGEPVIEKTTYSGFFRTDLDTVLNRLGVDQLILTGCVTNICIQYTAADAVMHGYRVTVPADCVADLDPEQGEHALEQMEHVLGVHVDRSKVNKSGRFMI
ncbi:MAG TPA: isochorismatase family cysteine hydrolase [Desulfomicrobiaceae bacterium]|nr:isochorismatase family cysteine hydrolase [Desulfomicrobiaceae bacterium]